MSVEPGYEWDKDHRGLTARERQILSMLVNDESYAKIGEKVGLSKQRVGAVVKSLERKGILKRKDGSITIVTVKPEPVEPDG